jgi:choline dehydrogenase-like flavoprotein
MIVYMGAVTSKRRDDGGKRADPIGFGMGLGLNLALSKGELKLKSNDYRDQPYLDYNLLEDDEDLRRYRDGVRMLVSLENHPSMAALIDHRLEPSEDDLQSDDALDTWIKTYVGTGHHVSCTAKMGVESDPMAVVNQYGQVYGVEGLRVADASIMPDCVRANINVTVMAIGERVADFISKRH